MCTDNKKYVYSGVDMCYYNSVVSLFWCLVTVIYDNKCNIKENTKYYLGNKNDQFYQG